MYYGKTLFDITSTFSLCRHYFAIPQLKIVKKCSTNGELSNVRVLILQPLHAITILIAPPSPSDIALIGTKGYHYTLEFDVPYSDSSDL